MPAYTAARRLVSAGLLSLLLGACGRDHDYAVVVSWLINGLAPDSELCEAYGIETVRLTLLDDDDRNRTLEADCSDAVVLSDGFEYGGFITTEGFDYEDLYRFEVAMLDGSGEAVASYQGTFQAFYGDLTPVELVPLEYFDPFGDYASIGGSFSVSPGPLAESCAAAGIDAVEIWIASVTDPDFVDAVVIASAPCESGTISSDGAVLALGDYQAKYVAVDSGLNVIAESEAFSVLVDAPLDITLRGVRF